MPDPNPFPTVHISSAVVRVAEDSRADVVRRIQEELPGAEVMHAEASTIIVVMETAETGAAGTLLARMAALEGVISANLAFEQTESAQSLGEPI